MFSVSQHLSKSYWALEFCRRLLRNLKEFFSMLLERTEYNCYCSKISGILASPLSPGIGYVTDTIFIRCQFFLCRHFITKISLLNVYYIFCEFVLFLQGYFLKDMAFKVPLQTHRNVNFWKHSLRSVCSMICNLVLPTEGFTESHCYLACTYFQFWNKSEMNCEMIAEKHQVRFTVLPCNKKKLNDFDWFSFCIFYFSLNQKLKLTLEEIVGQEVPTDMDQTWRKYSHQHLWKKTVKFHIQQSAECMLSGHWNISFGFFCRQHLPLLYHLCIFPVICCRKLGRLRGSLL